jgi:hypothetical protein
VTAAELREFFIELGGGPDTQVTSRPHIQVGVVETEDGADGLGGRRALPTVADRVELVGETFAQLGRDGTLQLADLEAVARAIVNGLEKNADAFAQCAPWDEEAQWPAVHAHNVATLAAGLARMAGLEVDVGGDRAASLLRHRTRGRRRRISSSSSSSRSARSSRPRPSPGRLAILLDTPHAPYLP